MSSRVVFEAWLAEIAQIQSLKGLYLRESRITNAGLAHLAKLTSLEELALGQGRMTNAGLAHLAKLRSLRYLMLSGKNFTDAGMVHLKSIPSLRILHAGHLPHLTDAALVHIAQVKTLENLSLHWVEAITVNKGRVGDPLHDYDLICLAKLTSLKDLQVGHTGITDEALLYLEQLPTISILDILEGANFSPAGVQRFRRNMPDLVIFRPNLRAVMKQPSRQRPVPTPRK